AARSPSCAPGLPCLRSRAVLLLLDACRIASRGPDGIARSQMPHITDVHGHLFASAEVDDQPAARVDRPGGAVQRGRMLSPRAPLPQGIDPHRTPECEARHSVALVGAGADTVSPCGLEQ